MHGAMSAYSLLMLLQMAKKSGPAQQKRSFSTSVRHNKHTAETYFKDVDSSPPASKKTHQVDGAATGPDVQRPDEPLTGPWSRAGAETKEYETVCTRLRSEGIGRV